MEIPPIPALPGLDKHPPIIQKVSPLFPGRGFKATNVQTGVVVSGCLNIRALITTLEEEGACEIDMLVCGCGDAGCHGFWYESVRKTKTFVHWTIEQNEHEHELYFDRKIYEKSAIQLLWQWNNEQWHGSDTCNISYRNYADFNHATHLLLEKKPHLKAYWQEIENKKHPQT
jgi:hypothetical protein